MNAQQQVAPLKVILPADLSRFYAERGYLAPTPQEDRTHARLNVRTTAGIQFTSQPLAAIASQVEPEMFGTVLVKDISKSGIAILSHHQIYPGEQCLIYLNGRAITVIANRCRRLGPYCYEVGAVIDEVEAIE